MNIGSGLKEREEVNSMLLTDRGENLLKGGMGMNFPSKEVSWEEYLQRTKSMVPGWIFRGQSCDERIKSSFERALDSYGIPYSDAPEIEEYMIRDFKRKYEGIDFEIVSKDTFYCLSLMQHYGCPTRLLDWTYSPYMAAFFAVENMSLEKKAERNAFVFCLNHKWINKSARSNINNDELFNMRFCDKTMTDDSFIPLYMDKKRKSFILADNPYQLHRRLSIQKGVFVIQGDISLSILENIDSMKDWKSPKNIIKFKLRIKNGDELDRVYEDLRLMNITHESLFPGLDGFAKSLKQNLYWYRDLKGIKDNIEPSR
jgi:hypothetical protein